MKLINVISVHQNSFTNSTQKNPLEKLVVSQLVKFKAINLLHVQKSLLVVSVLSQRNPVYILTSYLLKIPVHFNIILQCMTVSHVVST